VLLKIVYLLTCRVLGAAALVDLQVICRILFSSGTGAVAVLERRRAAAQAGSRR
jgi:hypothetical protein